MHGCGQSTAMRHQQQVKMRRHDNIAEEQKVTFGALLIKMSKHKVTLTG